MFIVQRGWSDADQQAGKNKIYADIWLLGLFSDFGGIVVSYS